MISSLSIKNFRGFEKLILQDLTKFNVIVGDSGSGKTALLEAIFLAGAANPEVYMRMRGWRGMGQAVQVSGSKRSFESVFRELFFGFQKKTTATISFIDSNAGKRSVDITYQSNEQYSLEPGSDSVNPWVVDPILFTWNLDGKVNLGRVEFQKDGRMAFLGFSQVYPVWLVSPQAPDLLTEHFSELSKRNDIGPLIASVNDVFPSVTSLSLESIAGQLVICASVPYLSEKIPLGMISGGINKFLWILLAIASNENGIVMIDEFENALYFSSLKPIMRSIVSFAELYRVQILATTHSHEALAAIASVMEERPEQFTLMRASRDTEGKLSMAATHGPKAISIIEQGIEVR
jgi:predicted ATPase